MQMHGLVGLSPAGIDDGCRASRQLQTTMWQEFVSSHPHTLFLYLMVVTPYLAIECPVPLL